MRWSTQAQQAPPSAVHSSPLTPLKSALNSAQPSSGGRMRHSSRSAPRVSRVLSQLENRLARSQPSSPTVVTGAGRPGSIWARLRKNGSLSLCPASLAPFIVPPA